MRTTYKVLAYLLAVEVLVQAMAIAYGLSRLHKWVDEEGGALTKAVGDSDEGFPGVGGFMAHGINGTMAVPLIVLLLLIVSLFTKMVGATRRAAILLGMVVVQVFLGIFSHELPAAIMLHALNAFGIFVMAVLTARSVGTASAAHASTPAQASVSV